MSKKLKIKFSDNLLKIINKLDNDGDYLAYEILYLSDPAAEYKNDLGISNLDVGKDYHFTATINGNKSQIKIGKFVREYIGTLFKGKNITDFANKYNKLKNNKSKMPEMGKKIVVPEFNYNPKDPRATFLSLTTMTYPHGNEEDVVKFLPNLNIDKFGNRWKIIGGNSQPDVMFTSHLDTADFDQVKTNLFSRMEGGDEIIYTDGKSIIGADDKAGVTTMLYMMAHGVQGLYYFFIGEERGGIGSNKLSFDFDNQPHLKNVKKCISFDRRRTGSVITKQLGRVCCSDKFATALCEEYNKNGLNFSIDPTGVYTDSASFIDEIPECTNISVGYENEHTVREIQNMSFLEKLCKASVNVNWSGLPVERKVGFDQSVFLKYKSLIGDIKMNVFDVDVRVIGSGDRVIISIDIDGVNNIQNCYSALADVNFILEKHKITNAMALIVDSYIKIELN